MVRRGSDEGNRLAAARRYARTHAEILSQLERLVDEHENAGRSALDLTLSQLSNPREGGIPVAARSTLGAHFPAGIHQALSEVALIKRQRGQQVPRSLVLAESNLRESERTQAVDAANIHERIRNLDRLVGADPVAVLEDAIFLKVDPKYIFVIAEKAVTNPARWGWLGGSSEKTQEVIHRTLDVLERSVTSLQRPITQMQSNERYEGLRPVLEGLWELSGLGEEDLKWRPDPTFLAHAIVRLHRVIESALLPLPEELWTPIQWSRLCNQFRVDHLDSVTSDTVGYEISRVIELSDIYSRRAFSSISPSTRLDDPTNRERATLARYILRALVAVDLAYPHERRNAKEGSARKVARSVLLWIDPDSSVSARIAWAYSRMLLERESPMEEVSEVLLDDFGYGILAAFAIRSRAESDVQRNLRRRGTHDSFWFEMPGAFLRLHELLLAQGRVAVEPRENEQIDAPIRSLVRAHMRSVVSEMLAGQHPESGSKSTSHEYQTRVIMFYAAELRAEQYRRRELDGYGRR